MFDTTRRSLFAFLALGAFAMNASGCIFSIGGSGGDYEIDPPDWIIGTWEDDRGEVWIFSRNDIETSAGGIVASLTDTYDTIIELQNDDTTYRIEASLLGLPAEFTFEMTSPTTFVTSNVTYTLQ